MGSFVRADRYAHRSGACRRAVHINFIRYGNVDKQVRRSRAVESHWGHVEQGRPRRPVGVKY